MYQSELVDLILKTEDYVSKGAPLYEIYSEELNNATKPNGRNGNEPNENVKVFMPNFENPIH